MTSTAPIRMLIVDDEPAARELVREMLEGEVQQKTIEIVGECGDGCTAVQLISETSPDLLFLDVQMPEMNGFEVLSKLPNDELPLVIFVTAFDSYALRAFEVHALDYLLKPFDRERFDHALERAKNALARASADQVNQRILRLLEERGLNQAQSPAYLQRFAIKSDGRIFFVRAEEIEWIEAQGNYVSLHANKRRYLFREPIGQLETQLDPRKFQRIHRSTIVNLDFIRELQPLFRGEYLVVMESGSELKLSQNYRSNLQQQLGGKV